MGGFSLLRTVKMLSVRVPLHADMSVSYLDLFTQLALDGLGFNSLGEVTGFRF